MISLRKTKLADLDKIAVIHKSAYGSDHFSSRFSEKMLRKYYESFLDNNEYCYSATNEYNEMVGFIIAGNNTAEAVLKFSQSNTLALIWYSLLTPAEIFSKAKGFLRNLVTRKHEESVSRVKLRLLSIATGSQWQGLGYGKQMIAEFEKQLRNVGILAYGLSVRTKNLRAVKFYVANGFEEEARNNKSIYFIKRLG